MAKIEKTNKTETPPNKKTFGRTVFLMIVFGVVVFIPVIWKLWNLQITRHDVLTEEATSQQSSTTTLSSTRGTIYDANGNVLAISSTAYDIIISPKAIAEKQAAYDEARAEALEAGDAETAAQYDVDVQALVVSGMAALLDLDEAALNEKCEDTNSQYKRLAQKVDSDVEEAVRAYISEYSLSGCIYLQANSKRYYPYATLAAQIIGFTNDAGGAYGLEATFDSVLTGQDGYIVSATDVSGNELLAFYQDYYEAEDGSSLYLTLDMNIQAMCEELLAEGIEKYEIQNGGFIIVMECKTGAILGMASSPTYDLNSYSTVVDESLLADVETWIAEYIEAGMTEEAAAQQANSDALNTMWRNRAVNDTYEPGSTFKPLILAAALEEGLTYLEETFTCTGSLTVLDYDIACSNRYGHGLQDLAAAVGNSCNPVFMTLGLRLGKSLLYQYFEAFGISTVDGDSLSTGIDLPGESGSIVWAYEDVSAANVATASVGQRLRVTPIQLITAVNAVINGGYYYQPYVVDYIEDADGNVTYSADNTALRQVISEATSEVCRELLEGVVANGMTGKNAYRAGYRIGGKTGTSETYSEHEYIVSFIGFAPADDPEIIVLVAFDTPEYNEATDDMTTPGGTYISGGNMAAPIAGDLLVSVLDYLDYGKQYTEEELSGADSLVPYLTGYKLAYAEAVAEEYGFTCRVVGEGDDTSIVQAQTAKGGSYIPEGCELILYIGDATPPDSVTVPDLTGMTPTQVSEALDALGLYLKATGASQYYTSATVAYSQSTDAGESVAPGTVITVTFIDTSAADNETDVVG